jgi:putative flippase GtrA
VSRQGFWFLAVGGTAALTHLAVLTLLTGRMWPELANAAGFCVAFGVSFAGQRWLTFTDTTTTTAQSLWRFAVTSQAGFALNEVVFSLLLRGAGWSPSASWFCATALAAGQTWVLGRFWAFRR